MKFETSRVEDAIAFIEAKGLHRFRGKGGQKEMRVITTGEVQGLLSAHNVFSHPGSISSTSICQ